jgi:hypothetical protein
VSLTGETRATPTLDDTFETMTAGDAANIDAFGLLEYGVDVDFLLEEVAGEGYLGLNISTIDLDFSDEGLALTDMGVGKLGHLSVCDDTDDGCGFQDLLFLGLSSCLTFSSGELGAVFGEGFLLAVTPVAVKAAAAFLAQVLSPNGSDASETVGSLTVANETNAHHGWGLDDGHGFDDFLLVHLASRALKVTNNVGHTSLESDEGGQVGLVGGLILGEGTNATTNMAASLLGEEPKITVTGVFKLSVGHLIQKKFLQ